ncbi:MAG TPA: 1-acyl-sn-glycerol-3-phosphate acyltransferase [Chloroflexota bacterium]|nr:1-acyl-sn-glycerol-3-phosphate acyltransferase [Chloroflexota bacterium]
MSVGTPRVPRYRPSLLTALRAIVYVARGRPRSLGHDAYYAVAAMPCPPLVRGVEHLPDSGPYCVVANHYERPGLWMAWPGLLLAQAVMEKSGSDLHWVAIEEWDSFRIRGIQIPPVLTRLVFDRTYQVYGIIAMPPPYASAKERAGAIRDTAHQVRNGAIVGLMPEGTVGETPELLPAREGVGTFLALLAAAGAPICPAGIHEEEGKLIVRFGPPFKPEVPRGVSREDADRRVRDQVMTSIRDLLPPSLWGAYRPSD